MTDPTPSVPDSAEQIAERIADIIWGLQGGVDIQKKGVSLITNALTAFGRAQYERGMKSGMVKARWSGHALEQRAFGFREGIEKAAEVCNVHSKCIQNDYYNCANDIKDKILGLLPKEGAKPGGFIHIFLLVIIAAAVAMTGCVTLAEHRRAMEQAEGTGYIKGISDASLTCDKTCFRALDVCEKQIAEAHAIALEMRHAIDKKPKLVNGVPPCGDHDPSFFGSKGCYVDHWPSMSVPNYDGGGR